MSNLLELMEGIRLGTKCRKLFRRLRVHNIDPWDAENPKFMYYDLCCEIKKGRGFVREVGYNIGYLLNPREAYYNAKWLGII